MASRRAGNGGRNTSREDKRRNAAVKLNTYKARAAEKSLSAKAAGLGSSTAPAVIERPMVEQYAARWPPRWQQLPKASRSPARSALNELRRHFLGPVLAKK